MVINFYNHSCFKAQSGDIIIAFDPPSKESKFKAPRFQADIILISHNNLNHNGRDALNLKQESERYVLDLPGEYEIKDILIKGIQSRIENENENLVNTIFTLDIEDMRICHMGDFAENTLRPEIKEALGKIDILFFPVGGDFLEVSHGAAIVNEIEPAIVIPMHYDASEKNNEKLQEFLKEFSDDQIERVEKLTVKKKDINEENLKVAVLESNL